MTLTLTHTRASRANRCSNCTTNCATTAAPVWMLYVCVCVGCEVWGSGGAQRWHVVDAIMTLACKLISKYNIKCQ